MKTFQLSTILRVLETFKNPAVTQLELVHKLVFSLDPQQWVIAIDKTVANRLITGARSLSQATKKTIMKTPYVELKQRLEKNVVPLLQESKLEKIAKSIKIILNDDDSIPLKTHIGPMDDNSFSKKDILTTDSLPFLDLLTGTLYYVAINSITNPEEKEKLSEYLKNLSYCIEQSKNSLLSSNDEKAIEDLLIDADNGIPDAASCLGYMYFHGIYPIPQNYYRAGFYLHKAALQGDAEAIYMLSYIFKKGLDVEQDLEKARFLLKTSAKLGHAPAEFDLGMCYYEGDGVLKDITNAIELWEKAAEQDNANALLALGVAYESGIEGIVKRNIGIAYKYYNKAKKLGHPLAQKYLDDLL